MVLARAICWNNKYHIININGIAGYSHKFILFPLNAALVEWFQVIICELQHWRADSIITLELFLLNFLDNSKK